MAINAQLNPGGAGGSETNLLSMLSALGEYGGAFDITLLALERYVEEFREVAPFTDVIAWPYGEGQGIETAPPPSSFGKALRRALRPHVGLYDDTAEFFRHLNRASPDLQLKAQIDKTLKGVGAGAVHFHTPQLFDTSLPFLYEPWDLQYLHYPEFFTEDEFLRRDRTYRLGCRRAKLVLTATEWVKQDIVTNFGISPSKIVVLPRSSYTARKELTDEQIESELAAAHTPKHFIFYPAMCFEHKNHLRLFRALAMLRDREGLVIPLVLSGRPHKPFLATFQRAILDLKLESQVTVLGRISDSLLTALYRRARFLIFPSLFEGLSLPMLEAFYHGLPVVAARETCLPEVIGDAGILFDAKDEEAIAAVIAQTWRLDRSELQPLVENGKKRLSRYSWEDSRVLLAACYKHVLGAPMTDEETDVFGLALAS